MIANDCCPKCDTYKKYPGADFCCRTCRDTNGQSHGNSSHTSCSGSMKQSNCCPKCGTYEKYPGADFCCRTCRDTNGQSHGKSSHTSCSGSIQKQSNNCINLKTGQPMYDSNTICFYNTNELYYELTNFYPSPITINSITYLTVEHYFQSQKFSDINIQKQISMSNTPRDAFNLAQNYAKQNPQSVYSDWHSSRKFRIMKEALIQKFSQNPTLRKLLINTGNKVLVEHTDKDTEWGDGGDGSGNNNLGKLLVEVRQGILTGQYGGSKNNIDYDKYVKYKYKYLELKKQKMLGGNNTNDTVVVKYFNDLRNKYKYLGELFTKWAFGSDIYKKYILLREFMKEEYNVLDIVNIIANNIVNADQKIVQFMRTHPFIVGCGNNILLLKIDGIYEYDIKKNSHNKIENYEGDVISLHYSAYEPYFKMILTTKGLYVTGRNASGQLGLDNFIDQSTFQKVCVCYSGDIISVNVGISHTIILTISGLYSCGSNHYGELGLDIDYSSTSQNTFKKIDNKFYEGNIISVSCGYNHTMILTTIGLYGCGNNNDGQLGIDIPYDNKTKKFLKINNKTYDGDIIQLYCGTNNSIIVTSNGLYGCGENRAGQLGLGTNSNQHTFKKINIDFNNNDIVSIICGISCTMILTVNELYISGIHSFFLNNSGSTTTFQKIDKNLYKGDIISIPTNNPYNTITLTTDGLYTRTNKSLLKIEM